MINDSFLLSVLTRSKISSSQFNILFLYLTLNKMSEKKFPNFCYLLICIFNKVSSDHLFHYFTLKIKKKKWLKWYSILESVLYFIFEGIAKNGFHLNYNDGDFENIVKFATKISQIDKLLIFILINYF